MISRIVPWRAASPAFCESTTMRSPFVADTAIDRLLRLREMVGRDYRSDQAVREGPSGTALTEHSVHCRRSCSPVGGRAVSSCPAVRSGGWGHDPGLPVPYAGRHIHRRGEED